MALDQIIGNYSGRLGDLCGLIRGDDRQLQADLLGFILPPGDREAARAFQPGESPGRIYQQFRAIDRARTEVEAAEQDRHNIYLKAINARNVGELIANQSENLAQMFLEDGASLAALERLRGREEARVSRATARIQAEEARRAAAGRTFTWLVQDVTAAAALGVTIAFPPAGASILALIAAGSAAAAQQAHGGYHRDNSIVAWGRMNADGTLSRNYGVASVSKSTPVTGCYFISIRSPMQSSTHMIPAVTVRPTGQPRLATVQTTSSTGFSVHTIGFTAGNPVGQDTAFVFVVTGR